MQPKIEPVFISFNKYLLSSSLHGVYILMGGGDNSKREEINNNVTAIGD